MPTRNRSSIAGLALAAALLSGACSPAPAPPTPPDAAYSVRGEIARLPSGAQSELWIHHEAIPDFRDESGATVGMESMTMPFPLAPGVSLDGIAPGDRIAFDFEVRWKGQGRPLAITRLEKLPEGTRLGFDAPATDAIAAPEGDQPADRPNGETPQ